MYRVNVQSKCMYREKLCTEIDLVSTLSLNGSIANVFDTALVNRLSSLKWGINRSIHVVSVGRLH